ncbi:hypothetical protein [Priestia megaterium]|uniref:hypothetical protein n=1 Tax=Priestia megaterium TaxID=1404 RepID=UPI00263BA76E|nr:hypothetical protein [Priestia megaterium]MDN4862882.1 hypothetical protein [Priestia megaterium]
MDKLQLKDTMLAKVEELSAKRQAVGEHLELISKAKFEGVNRIIQLKEQIEEHKKQAVGSTDREEVKTQLEAVDTLSRELEVQSLLAGKEQNVLETMLVPLIEEVLGYHKEAVALFNQLEKVYVSDMSIVSMEEDVTLINSIGNEINDALSHMSVVMMKYKLIPNQSASYQTANYGSIHIGQRSLYSVCNGLKAELRKFKNYNNL